MTFDNVLTQIILWGNIVKPNQIANFRRYLAEMLRRRRVIVISENDNIKALICFFLTDSVSKFNNRPLWSCPPDTNNGNIFFVDKMIAEHWTPSLRRYLRDEVELRFPQVTEAYWLREPNNRSVIINRRRTHGLYSQVS